MPNPIGDWTIHELDLLGTDFDDAIARQLGRTREAVRSKRREEGIAPYVDPASPKLVFENALQKMTTARLTRLQAAITAELARRNTNPHA